MKNKLKRINRILSARNGTSILKYLEGAKFIAIGQGLTLYSPNGSNWYSDSGLTSPVSMVNQSAYKINKLTPGEISNGIWTENSDNNLNKGLNSGVFDYGLSAIQGMGTALGMQQKTDDSRLTRGMDSGYDFVADNAANFGPYGKIVSQGMKTAGAITDAAQALGLRTDQMTTLDKILSSKWFLLTPTGIINSAFGKNADSYSMDTSAIERIGSGYTGTVDQMYALQEDAGKKFGLFSGKARRELNTKLADIGLKENQLADINDTVTNQRLNVKSGVEQARYNYEFMVNGGYGQKYTQVAKQGGVLEELHWEPEIELEWDIDSEINLFQQGGVLEELHWEPLLDNTSKIFKQGGSIKESDIPEIEETSQKNVIPEGALHKNKHHMEHTKGLTQKGIPVIDENGEQQAEIEHSEIIFNLEVTKKLEELYNTYYSENSTNKEKDEAAIQAGKLLVYLILENTDDRTGLIDKVKID